MAFGRSNTTEENISTIQGTQIENVGRFTTVTCDLGCKEKCL